MRKLCEMFAAIVAIALVSTGCADKAEIEERAFVLSAALSTDGGELVLSVAAANPAGIAGNGEGDKQFVKTARGRNLEECVEKIAEDTSGKVYFGHLKAIILSENIAENAQNLTEFAQNESEIAQNLNEIARIFEEKAKKNGANAEKIFVLRSGDPKAVVSAKPNNDGVSGQYIANYYKNNHNKKPVTLSGLNRGLRESNPPVLPFCEGKNDEITIK